MCVCVCFAQRRLNYCRPNLLPPVDCLLSSSCGSNAAGRRWRRRRGRRRRRRHPTSREKKSFRRWQSLNKTTLIFSAQLVSFCWPRRARHCPGRRNWRPPMMMMLLPPMIKRTVRVSPSGRPHQNANGTATIPIPRCPQLSGYAIKLRSFALPSTWVASRSTQTTGSRACAESTWPRQPGHVWLERKRPSLKGTKLTQNKK